ncbi:RNA polymerase sigma factor [Mangrovibacterium lignilyticum]|uniref:RNA polymerase sigma factor n=1 Tax=Mangrovibacterium lignilyticum TaxID=2668052 RepID=UPI0013D526FB|nr:RNA polymerase sigma-70 factor [Mangrovibacterium lignilyticum]
MDQPFNVEQLRRGDSRAFKQFFQYYGEKVFAFAFSYLKNETDAQEIVQEVFLKVWKNRQNLKVNTSLQAYLFTITFNAVKKTFLRRSKEQAFKHSLVDELDSETDVQDFENQYQLVIAKLELFIEEMPERRRQIFIARKKEGKPVKQIAEEMDISVKTIENQITEAMKYLKNRFGTELPEGLNLLVLFLDYDH